MNEERAVSRHRWILIGIFVFTIPLITPYLRGDGIAYYAYVASMVVDGDLQFENQYRRADLARCSRYFDEQGRPLEELRTPTGHLLNYHSAGPALLWSPFFAVAHGGVHVHNALVPAESAIEADGYSRPYLWLSALGTAVFGFAGLLFAHAVALRIASPFAAFFATLGLWFASNLLVYMYLLPFLSHPASILVDGAFLYVWWRTARDPAELPTLRSGPAWLGLGTLAGFAFSTYYMGALFGIFVLADGVVILRSWIASGASAATHLRNALRIALPGLGGVLLGALPHAIPKWILYADPLALGYGLEWQPERPYLLEVLFSSHHGLLSWHPVYALGLAGLALSLSRLPRLAIASLLVFASCVWLVASKPNWHGGSAFGNRYFLLLVPLFVVGLAAFLDLAAGALARPLGSLRRARLGLVALLAVLAVWNVGFLFQWATNVVPNRGPVSLREVARNQVTVVPARFATVLFGFVTDRGAVVKQIEREDMQELYEYPKFRELKGVCRPVNGG